MTGPIVAVIVPWRETDEHRAAAWAHHRHRWRTAHPDWQIIEGRPPTGPWVKALAIADGLTRTDADILILADADVWCDGVALAVDQVAAGAAWAIPHHHVYRLTADATAAVLAGGPLGGRLDRKPYRGFAGGGLTVIHRDLLERAPLDHRFVGWGQEDQAAAYSWHTLGGAPWRGRADLWHLWHPPQRRWSIQWGSQASHALWRRYRAANGNTDRMTALIAEARSTPPSARAVTPREDHSMGTTNTWHNRNDGRTTTTRDGTQRDRIFRRHPDWVLEEPAPPPTPAINIEVTGSDAALVGVVKDAIKASGGGDPVDGPTDDEAADEPEPVANDESTADDDGEAGSDDTPPPAEMDTATASPETTPTAGEAANPPEEPAPGVSDDGPELRHTGAGWYEIVIDGETRDRVRGKEAAEDRAAELLGYPAAIDS